jgi:hypothetical protein
MNQGHSQQLGDSVSAVAIRNGESRAPHFVPKFRYDCELVRDGQVIDAWSAENVVTTEGAASLLDVYFDGATQITTWYLGLISSASYVSTPDITDVAANLNGATNGWAECSASYAPDYDTPGGTARGTITFGEPSGTDLVSLVSSSAINFIFSGTGTVKGSFVASNGTRLNNTGVLYSAALFSGDKAVVDNDQLNVTVTVSLDLSYTP